MTTEPTGEHPWVIVTWDVIQPGDRVEAPDGAEFHVVARIDFPDDAELTFLLVPMSGPGKPDLDATTFPTDRPRGTRVRAWRFNDSAAIPGAEAFATGRLRLAGFDVSEVPGE